MSDTRILTTEVNGRRVTVSHDLRDHAERAAFYAAGCCDRYAASHPGARFCPSCLLVNEAAYPSASGVTAAQ